MNDCFEMINGMVTENSDNFRVHIFCARFFSDLYKKTGEKDFQKLTAYHFRKSRELNPALE